MDTISRWVPLMAVLVACDAPGSRSVGAVDGEVDGVAEVVGDVVVQTDTPDTFVMIDASDSGPSLDTGTEGEVVAPGTGTAEAPIVNCLADAECASGEVCCTSPLGYLSDCVAAAECNPGLHDACLVDAQCAARRPEWSVCCHDRGNRNYCAPVRETCQPLVGCESAADCRDNGSDTCCSEHPYYGGRWCTNEFFANNVERDCR